MALQEKIFKATHERNGIQRYIARRFLFGLCQRLGIHVTGNHFYEIIPDTRLVEQKYVDGPRTLPGIDWRFAECEARAIRLIERYGAEFTKFTPRFGFKEVNPYFRGMDALMLYGMLRDLKPAKIVEVGQGFSTRIALAALEQNALETGKSPTFVSLDPYARFRPADVPACLKLQLIESQIQDANVDSLLENCEVLFIDSSHVHKFGSDVAFEMSELYPRLAPNTILHIHDIFSPFDYPKDWMVRHKRFWNEQYMMECFLMYNSAFQIHLPVNYLVQESKALASVMKTQSLDPDFRFSGYSLYLKRS